LSFGRSDRNQGARFAVHLPNCHGTNTHQV
jgi:hypothetical protein